VDNSARPLGGRADPRHAVRVEQPVRWQVGVLRSGVENVAWVTGGSAPEWGSARAATIAAVRGLVAAEGRQEYRLQIGDVEGIVNPGLDSDGNVVLGDLERLIPAARNPT
jgi:hypothetical protein